MWLQDYLVSNDVAKLCESAIQTASPDLTASPADVERFMSAVRETREEREIQWRRLEIPVEMPRQRVRQLQALHSTRKLTRR